MGKAHLKTGPEGQEGGVLVINQINAQNPVLSQPAHRTATYRYDDTRCCIIQFRPPDDEHIVLETSRVM